MNMIKLYILDWAYTLGKNHPLAGNPIIEVQSMDDVWGYMQRFHNEGFNVALRSKHYKSTDGSWTIMIVVDNNFFTQR